MGQRWTARQILEKLVSFPTVSRDSNLDLVDWVEEYLDDHGIGARRVWNAERTKAALYANIGPETEGGVLLSGHTDVVPVDGQNWSSDPWTVTERDGRLYGRGTCDMKGFDALTLAAVPLALEAGVTRPLQIALSFDEEVGCLGAPAMIDEIADRLPKAAAAIVGEPTRLACVTGHKASAGYHTHVRGYPVHSSMMHKGINAIMWGAKLIDWANDRNAETMRKTPGEMAQLFDPPFTTLHVGEIAGGTAHNITAESCTFMLDFRVVPGEDPEAWRQAYLDKAAEIEAAMQEIRPEAGIEITPGFAIPGLKPESDSAAERLVRQLTGDNDAHNVSYGTEAGQFQERGFSTVVCGPGDIAQAHQADEFIETAQFEAGEAFMQRLVEHLCR